MAKFKISGIWKDKNSVITHYAFHTVYDNSISRAIKTSKQDAVAKLDSFGNTAVTWVWNYGKSFWENGENVEVIDDKNGKYLRSNPDTTRDNLAHLIDYDWIK